MCNLDSIVGNAAGAVCANSSQGSGRLGCPGGRNASNMED